MAIGLAPEIENVVAEQIRREGTTPERLVSDNLRGLFIAPKLTLDRILGLAAQVYAVLSEQEVVDVEKIALDRSHFARPRQTFEERRS